MKIGNKIRSLLALVLCLSMFLSLFGCGSVEFEVDFVVAGEVYATIKTNGNETIRIPADPTKEGYIFAGWFWDYGEWTQPFTANSLLDAPLSSNMSVHAKFVKIGGNPDEDITTGGNGSGGDESDPPAVDTVTYKVTVKDNQGAPIAGVRLQICSKTTGICFVPQLVTDAGGVATTEKPEDAYEISIVAAEGYVFDKNTKISFEGNKTELIIVLDAYVPDEPETLYGIPVIEMTVDGAPYVYKAFTKSETASGSNLQFIVDDFVSRDPSTDALSYAVYDRNNKIQSKYKCTIVSVLNTLDSTFQEMKNFYDNEEQFELAILGAYDLSQCAANGFLRDLNRIDVDGFDLTHEAYDSNSIDQLTIRHSLYYVSGAMNDSTLDNAPANMFNTTLFASLQTKFVEEFGAGYADLYKMVEDGTWTVDAMMGMAELACVDVSASDGDPDYDKGDQLGYFGYIADTVYYWFGCDMRFAKNIDGYPSFDGSINTTDAEEVYNKLFELFNKPVNNPWITRGYSDTRKANFNSGRTLFTSYVLSDVRHQLYKDNKVPYGILPIAKYDTDQDDYRSVVYYQTNHAHLWALPVKCVSNSYSALMLQIMAVWSDLPDSTMDAYYIKTLYKAARDDGSRRSLDIIRDTLVFDIGLLFDNSWAQMDSKIKSLASTDAVGGNFNEFANAQAIETYTAKMDESLKQFKEYSKATND